MSGLPNYLFEYVFDDGVVFPRPVWEKALEEIPLPERKRYFSEDNLLYETVTDRIHVFSRGISLEKLDLTFFLEELSKELRRKAEELANQHNSVIDWSTAQVVLRDENRVRVTYFLVVQTKKCHRIGSETVSLVGDGDFEIDSSWTGTGYVRRCDIIETDDRFVFDIDDLRDTLI